MRKRKVFFKDSIELDIEIHVHSISFGYDPFPTMNHDDPRFSDSGGESEVEYSVYLIKNGEESKKLDITEFISKDKLNLFEEYICREVLENEQSEYEAGLEAKMEEMRDRE